MRRALIITTLFLVLVFIPARQIPQSAANHIRNQNESNLSIPADLVCLQKYSVSAKAPGPAVVPFASAETLQITIKDPNKFLDAKAASNVESYIVKGIETWNYACLNCSANNLVLVQINSHFYLNQVVARVFKESALDNPGQTQIPMFLFAFIKDLDLFIFQFRRSARSSGTFYEKLEREDAAIKNLCAFPHFDQLPRALQAARLAVRCESDQARPRKDSSTTLSLSVLDQLPSSIVARGIKDGVELNAGNYIFTTHVGEPLFGNGTTKVDLLKLLIHEEGHWIGLPDLDAESLMFWDRTRWTCINDDVVTKLSEVAQTGRTIHRNGVYK